MTADQLIAALDRGQLKLRQPNGNLWMVRRNGQTKRWVSRPGHFRIPLKIGFRSHAYLTHESIHDERFVVMGYGERL